MKRVLITGITGFIGSNLARKLGTSYKVYGLVREPLNLQYIEDLLPDIELLNWDGSYESMARIFEVAMPETVYHLATYYTGAHGADVVPKLVHSNILLGSYLLEAMAGSGCRKLVYATTIMEHYQGEEYRPLNLYAATKRAFSDLLAYYIDAGLMSAVTLVLTDTYGPGDRRPKILNLIRTAVKNGESLALSDGMQDYDLVYIDDVVRAFEVASDSIPDTGGYAGTFQVASTLPLSLRSTVELFLSVNELEFEAKWGGCPPAEREMRKAVRLYPVLPGWHPQVSLEEGLKNLFHSKWKEEK